MSWAILGPILIQVLMQVLGQFPWGEKIAGIIARFIPTTGDTPKAVGAAPIELKRFIVDFLRKAITDNVKLLVVRNLVLLVLNALDDRIFDMIWDRLFTMGAVTHPAPVHTAAPDHKQMFSSVVMPNGFDEEMKKEFGTTDFSKEVGAMTAKATDQAMAEDDVLTVKKSKK